MKSFLFTKIFKARIRESPLMTPQDAKRRALSLNVSQKKKRRKERKRNLSFFETFLSFCFLFAVPPFLFVFPALLLRLLNFFQSRAPLSPMAAAFSFYTAF